jgi:L-alanine-DL-glutamate epimerase-like enolase superfamily enzyme
VKLLWDVPTIHLRHPFILSDSQMTQRQVVIVRVLADGVEGFGEAAPSSYFGETCNSVTAVYNEAAPWICENVADTPLEKIDGYLTRQFPSAPSARSGLVMAVADWKAKSLGVPLWQMLNIDRPPVRPTSFTIGIDTADTLRLKIKEADGFSVLKIKMGRGDMDYEILETIRNATEKPLRIDVNEGWTFDEAVQKIKWLESLNVQMIEQPLPKEEAARMPEIRRQSAIPLFGDENIRSIDDIGRWDKHFDGVNIKLDKCGGLVQAVRMLNDARARGLQTMLGCMVQTSVGIAAAAHLGALTDFIDLDGHLLIKNDLFTGIRVEKGLLAVTEKAGLGVVPI